jgi:peptidoglycan/xylan/chitin deacetylase (PgdA/CDA1 family)
MSILMNQLKTRVSRGFVLAFHDIRPDRLCELIGYMQPAEVVSLSELVDRSKKGKSTSGLFAITVDDGVGETVRELSGLFRNRGWPATFYISTNYVDSAEGMGFQWWRNLVPFLPSKKIELKSGVVDLSWRGAVPQLSKKLEDMWHCQRAESYLPFTLELAEVVMRERGLSIDSIRPPEPITWPEVTELSRDELISFESHGVSHTAMSALTETELIFEMEHSRDVLTDHTGRPCRHLAYPFGSDRSIGPHTAAIAQLHYQSAATMTLGSVDSSNPWLLPRVPLYPGNRKWYANLKILLKCTRLGGLFNVSDGGILTGGREAATLVTSELQREVSPGNHHENIYHRPVQE